MHLCRFPWTSAAIPQNALIPQKMVLRMSKTIFNTPLYYGVFS
ncbi:hypothetical protein [Clostridium phage Amboise]|nr:hypothetical protein [Clostridium phage Amboise]